MVVRYLPDAPRFTRLSVNDEFCRVLGVQRKDVIDASAVSMIPVNKRPDMLSALTRVIKTKSVGLSTKVVARPGGGLVKIRWMYIPVVDASGSGRVVELIGVGEVID